jgi:hypothetical protein
LTINGINAATSEKVILRTATNLSFFDIPTGYSINLTNLVLMEPVSQAYCDQSC